MNMLRMKNFNLTSKISSNFYNFNRKVFGVSQNIINYRSDDNPKVFFSVDKNGTNIGKMTFELYANHCPLTAENFRQICTGDNKGKLSYKNNVFHRIISGFMAQGGDITRGNGTGGMSIYGRTFRDENLKLKHYKRGLLSMANAGPDTNGSQFFITFVECPWLDGNHCVFGELIEGEDVLKKIEAVGSRDGAPKADIKISDCGQLPKA